MPGATPRRPQAAADPRRAAQSARVTLAQVGRRAGVSTAAASYVLAGRTDQRITDETKDRIRAAAEELGYRPNAAAKTLRTGRSGTIAFVSENVASTPYATGAIAGALEAALKHDVLMFIAETMGDPEIERRLLQNMADRRVDAFIYAAMFTRKVSVPELLHDTPLVLLNCVSDDVAAPMVLPDEQSAGATAVRALIDAGHRDGIYYVGAVGRSWHGAPQWRYRTGLAISERIRAVRAELRRAKTSLAGTLTVTDWETSDGRDAVTRLLATGAIPRALICANDRLAFGAYQALTAASLKIPQGVSIISFDDSPIAADLQPALSSIAIPYEDMGRTAVDILLSNDQPSGRQLVPMPLHERQSIAPPRTASPR